MNSDVFTERVRNKSTEKKKHYSGKTSTPPNGELSSN